MAPLHRYQTKTIHTMKPSKPGLTHCLPVVLLLWSTCLLLTGCGKRSYQQFTLAQDPTIPSHSAIQAPMVNPYDLTVESSEETFQQFFVERGAEVIWTKLYFYFGSPFQFQDVNMVTDAVIYNDGEVQKALSKQNQLDKANMYNAIALYIAIKQQEAAFPDFLQRNRLDKVWQRLQYARLQEKLDLRRMLQGRSEEVQIEVLKRVCQFIGNHCPKLVELDLSDNGLTQLPAILGKLTNLKRLFLKNNQLAALPDNLGELINLDILDLSFNKFTQLPATLGDLTNLRALYLQQNQLTALPDTLGNLTQLKRIELGDNQLADLPESFQKLTNLKCSQGKYFNQGTAFGELSALVFQAFLLRNGLSKLWAIIEEAKTNQQHTLDLTEMLQNCTPLVKIQVLQGLFQFIQYHLPALVELNLSKNQLTQLPDSFERLPHLKILNLSKNQLMALPDSFGSLTSLNKLYLTENQLNVLPTTFGSLAQLQILELNHNQLIALPHTFVNLNNLDQINLNNNQLGQFPACLQNLTQLRVLQLSGNQLMALPAWLGNLTQLQVLSLRINQLTVLPDSFQYLTQLRILDLGLNQLTALPDAVGKFTQLNQLYLNDNQLRVLPESVEKLTNLREFSVYNNPLLQPNANIDQMRVELTPINLDTLLRPTLRDLAVARIVRNNIPYNTQDIPQDCINAIEYPKTYRVMLFITQLGNLTLHQPVPIITHRSYQEILDQLEIRTTVILMTQ